MSQEVATQTQQTPSLAGGGGVNAIVPQTADEAYRLASLIHKSGMAPYGLDSAEKVTIAILQGIELGMPPMMALQSIAVINNRPCLWGDGLIGVVRQSPACEWIKEWIDGEGDDMIAVCETKRKGEPEPIRRTFSVDDAQRAGLWQTKAKVTKKSKNGGTYEKDNDSPWYRYPKRMLQMRARALCLRDVYADILKGMQVREEVEDYQHQGPDNAKDVTPRQSGAERLAAAKQAQEQQPEPENKPEGFDPDHVTETIAKARAEPTVTLEADEEPGFDLGDADNTPAQQESEDPAPAEEPSPQGALDLYKAALQECQTAEEVDAITPKFSEAINGLDAAAKKAAKQLRQDRKAQIGEEGK